jgi:hypothetical protein
MAANPVGSTSWPTGSKCQLGELKRLVALEIHRLGGDPRIGGQLGFPGGHCTPDLVHNLDAIPPMVETLKAASAHVLATLSGAKIAPVAPPAASPPTISSGSIKPTPEPKVTRTAEQIQAEIPKRRIG